MASSTVTSSLEETAQGSGFISIEGTAQGRAGISRLQERLSAGGVGGTMGGALIEALSGAGLWGLLRGRRGGRTAAALCRRRTAGVVAGSAVGGYFGDLVWATHPTLAPGPEWGVALPVALMAAGSAAAVVAGRDA